MSTIMDNDVSVLNHSQRSQQCALTYSTHVLQTIAKDSNRVLCPLTLQLILGLTAAGANGSTQDQLLTFLKFESAESFSSFANGILDHLVSTDGGPNLSFATGVWIDQSISLRTSFKHVVHNIYGAYSTHVDFKTKHFDVPPQVNSWVREETGGLIKEILPYGAVNSLTRLIFANALYFKGEWRDKFHTFKTDEDDFYLLSGSSVRVPFMTTREDQFISVYDGFKVLRLPYKQGTEERQFSMYFFLPDAIDGLATLTEHVLKRPQRLQSLLPRYQVNVGTFKLPRFKISFGFKASDTLKELGLVLPFLGEADFCPMIDAQVIEGISVDEIYNKAFIEVNEEGTEAAASCSVVFEQQCLRYSRNQIDFIADHPFLFMLREDVAGLVVFVGDVLWP